MDKNKLFISSIASDASDLCSKYNLGLEISEYCTADNMDINYIDISKIVSEKIQGIDRFVFHGPFNELFPSAIDSKVRALSLDRFCQAYELAKKYNAKKIVFHSGYYSNMYYPCFFKERSIVFWKEFMDRIDGDIEVVIENVFDDDPEVLKEIIDKVNRPNLKLCLDIGHANCYTNIGVVNWIKELGSRISHFHIHNNDGKVDTHNSIDDGIIDMKEVFKAIDEYCPLSTISLEVMEARNSIKWLIEEGYIDEIR